MKTENLHIWIIGILTFLFSAFLFLIHISEFINVAVLKEVENYPFGCECVNSFSYKTAKHYSIASLLYSILFFLISFFSIRAVIRKKIKIILITLIVLITLFIGQYYI